MLTSVHPLSRCFIPNIYVALCTAVLVPLICLVAVLVVFIHAYTVTQQWKAYDDIYRGRTNSTGTQHGNRKCLNSQMFVVIHQHHGARPYRNTPQRTSVYVSTGKTQFPSTVFKGHPMNAQSDLDLRNL